MDEIYYEERFSAKTGERIIILDFEGWIDEVESGETSTHIITQCPYCLSAYKKDSTYNNKPYTKLKLYLQDNVGYCHRCSTSFFNYIPEDPEGLQLNTTYKELEVEPIIRDFTMGDTRYQLTGIQNKILSHDHLVKLYNRNPYIINYLDELKLVSYDNSRIAIPVFDSIDRDELIYYQLWQYPAVPKYFNPPIKTKPLVYLDHKIKSKLVITEGFFSGLACKVMYPNHTSCYIMGSYLTPTMESMIHDYVFEEILVYLDSEHLSWKIKNRLDNILEGITDIKVVPCNGKDDPDDVLMKRLGLR